MKKTLFILSIILATVSYGQQDFIMYGLQDIPQSSYNNPSNMYNGSFYIGLPAMSSNYFSFSHSGFAYSDAVTKQGDSLRLSFDDILNQLEDNNFLSFNSKLDLLSFGFSIGDKTQVSFNVTENITFRLNYPKDFFQFLIKGNTSFENNTADFSGLGFNGSHYREYGVGISRQLSEKLRVGVRAKYLYGMENIYSEKTDITITTNPNTFELTANANIAIRTSGIDDVDSEETETNYAFGRDNTGLGADLGLNYELNEKLSFNASVLDIGYINWKSFTKSHTNNGGEFSYSGIGIDVFSNNDSSSTSFDKVLDSLESAFNLEESTEAYSTSLPTRFYAGANYKLTERDMAGILIQSEFFQGSIKPSFTINYSRKMTKWITLASSYSVINRSYNNLGFGFSIDPGPIQLYVISDNVLGAFQPQHTKHLQLRFGINLIFGREKSTEIRPSYRGVFKPKNEEEEIEKSEEVDEKKDTIQEIIKPINPIDKSIDSINTKQSPNSIIDKLQIKPIDTLISKPIDSIKNTHIDILEDTITTSQDSIIDPFEKEVEKLQSEKEDTINELEKAEDNVKEFINIETPASVDSLEIESIPLDSTNSFQDSLKNSTDTITNALKPIVPNIDKDSLKNNNDSMPILDSIRTNTSQDSILNGADSLKSLLNPIEDIIQNSMFNPITDTINPIIKTDSLISNPKDSVPNKDSSSTKP